MNYLIQYQFADYRGNLRVNADDKEQALAKAKKLCNKLSSIPMAYTHFNIIEEK